jgi:hypothetical protein
METIYTIDDVLKMDKPTDKFLVTLDDNIYGVRFKGFKLRDCDSNEVYHQYYPNDVYELDYFADHELNYVFNYKILQTKTIGTTLVLVVGNQLVQNLELIERHFIDDKMAAEYRFQFPIFMPNSENTIEFMYMVPKLEQSVENKINNKEEINAKSDTFIFVDGKMMVHRRATYSYVPSTD